jgi:hypothetical protein
LLPPAPVETAWNGIQAAEGVLPPEELEELLLEDEELDEELLELLELLLEDELPEELEDDALLDELLEELLLDELPLLGELLLDELLLDELLLDELLLDVPPPLLPPLQAAMSNERPAIDARRCNSIMFLPRKATALLHCSAAIVLFEPC